MSTSEALAAVTDTLRQLLDSHLGGPDCTTLTPDAARTDTAIDQVNLFLYAVEPNAGWANLGARPPLALDLSYLLTVYGRNGDDVAAHAALGSAMRILHDHPVLGRDEVRGVRPGAGLHEQPERVRISHAPLSLDEMTKLWTAFGCPYRLSTSYTATVVLIDARRTAPVALPVLGRGDLSDRGVDVAADSAPFPTLARLAIVGEDRPAVRLGDTLRLTGHGITGGAARFRTRWWTSTVDLPITVSATGDLEVALPPDNPAAQELWPAGQYTVDVAVTDQGRTRVSNEVSFPLAPRVLAIAPNPAPRVLGAVTLSLTTRPWVWRGQRVSLLLGDREIFAQPLPDATERSATSTFRVTAAEAGQFLIRVRFDGVDSQPFGVTAAGERTFADTERVEIT